MDGIESITVMSILTYFTKNDDELISFKKFIEITGYPEDGALELLENLVARKILCIISTDIGVGEYGYPIIVYLKDKSEN